MPFKQKVGRIQSITQEACVSLVFSICCNKNAMICCNRKICVVGKNDEI